MKRSLLLFIVLVSTTVFFSKAQPLNPAAPPIVPLPVNLTDFAVKAVNGSAQLSWKTTHEQNSRVFAIENSRDGEQWTRIGSVKATGNSVIPCYYSYVHNQPFVGQNYYRLKTVDLNGASETSKIIPLTITMSAGIRIYPSPVSDHFIAEINGFQDALPYIILDANGKEVNSGVIRQNNQRISVQDLATGVYFFKVGKFEAVKFLK